MAQNSKIEWTDTTWNPVTGCTKVSPGCEHCYAETLHERFNGKGSFATVTLHPNRLDLPLRWKKPRRVFVNSMSDLFHKDIPDEFIAMVFAAMALAPQHTFQVLTKRHARMRSLLSDPWFFEGVLPHAVDQLSTSDYEFRYPLRNVWLGVSTEDQKWADIRIPALLDTPAAVRWISAEPLLGSIDLTKWMPPVSPMDPAVAPKTWAEWTWPGWVPDGIRRPVEEFWMERWGRGPHTWMRDMHEQGAPAFGATVTLDDGFGPNPSKTSGRFVHAWNNIGRIVHDDGTFSYTSFGPRDVRENQQLNWVVAGGESGRRARPMHPSWARSLRDQCASAGVPFLFKQWGEWGLEPRIDVRGRYDWKTTNVTVADDGTVYQPGDLAYPDGPRYGEAVRADHNHAHLTGMYRVGKTKAGRELDDRTWDEYPLGMAR
ncbi:DUF5131 family protein [Amycolatopsis sp. NPDC004368]